MTEMFSISGSKNVALNKPAYMRFTYDVWHAALAVDGNDGNKNRRIGCAQSVSKKRSFHHWWVDLEANYRVHAVKVAHSKSSCKTRLKEVSIFVDLEECVTMTMNETSQQYNCIKPMVGRQVSVVVFAKQLCLCELEVLADPDPVKGE